jgi:hypothetical protein
MFIGYNQRGEHIKLCSSVITNEHFCVFCSELINQIQNKSTTEQTEHVGI